MTIDQIEDAIRRATEELGAISRAHQAGLRGLEEQHRIVWRQQCEQLDRLYNMRMAAEIARRD